MNGQVLQLLCPFQVAWLQERAPLALGEKARRIGWTWCQALGEVLHLSALPPGQPQSSWHSSADMSASAEFIEDAARWAQMLNVVAGATGQAEVIDEQNGISAFVLRFANGSKLVAGSSNPKFFRSKGGRVGLDEFAFHEHARELYKAAHASALNWGHNCRIWSTHNGPRTLFNQMLVAARAGRLKAAVHRVTILDAVDQGLIERIDWRRAGMKGQIPAANPQRRQEWLDDLRSTCVDQDQWNEEFLCIPSSDSAALLNYELIRGCEREDLVVVEDPRQIRSNAPLYAGMDVGRQQDLSVFWVLAKVGDVFETRLIKTFSKTPYTIQEQFLDLIMQQNVRRICIDATGIGDMLAERASQRYGHRAEGVKFTMESKAGLAMPLVRLFEDRLVRVPADAQTREDLHKVRKIVTTAGNVRFDATHDEAGHADRFWALALAYQAADAVNIPLPAPLARKPLGW